MDTELLRQVYLKYQDQETGKVAFEDIKKILQELGKDIDSDEYSEVFRYKYFKGPDLPFDDFVDAMQGVEKGVDPKIIGNKIKIKTHTSKFFAKVEKAITGKKNGGVGGVGAQEEDLLIDWNFQVGSNASNSRFEAFAGIGLQRDHLVQHLSFAELSEDKYYVILRFKVADSQAAKQEFQDILDQALAMADAMLPPDFQQYKESLQFDFYTPNSENVYLRISSNHELFEFATSQANQFSSLFTPDIKLDFQLQTSQSFEHLNNNKSQQFLDAVFGQENLGFSAKFQATAGNEMIQSIHALLIEQIEKLKDASGYKKEKIGLPAFIFMLFQSFTFDLKFKSIGQFIQQFKILVPLDKTLEWELNKSPLTELGKGYSEASSEVPIVQQVVEFFRSQGRADVGVFLITPLVALKAEVELPGLGSFLDPYFNQQ